VHFSSGFIVTAPKGSADAFSRLSEAGLQKGEQFVKRLEVELATCVDFFNPTDESVLQRLGVRTEPEHERVSHREASVRQAPEMARETRV
jgi:hypothetical protein